MKLYITQIRSEENLVETGTAIIDGLPADEALGALVREALDVKGGVSVTVRRDDRTLS